MSAERSSSLTGSPAPAPPTGTAGKLIKLVVIVGVLVMLCLIGAMGSCAYVVYRAKQKAQKIQATHRQNHSGKVADQPEGNQAGDKHSAPANSPSALAAAVPATSAPAVNTSTIPADLGAPDAPVKFNGDQAHDWALRYERTDGGPEADLVVRTGDINNLGFGWPKDYDPFSGKSTPPHPFPWSPKPGTPDGTDRMLLGSGVTQADFNEHPFAGEGYTSSLLRPCQQSPDASTCKPRQDPCHSRSCSLWEICRQRSMRYSFKSSSMTSRHHPSTRIFRQA